MGLRDFTDGTGCRWRVWDIRPEQMHRAARAEDYLQAVISGWLAFESEGGSEKRRLSPIPSGWETATEEELERLLDRAEPVREGTGAARAERESSAQDASQSDSVLGNFRTFRYPGGRYWTVSEHPTETAGVRPQHALLVFTSGARTLETRNRPPDWTRMSDMQLADLLYRSFPRSDSDTNRTAYRRRRGDGA